MKKQIMVISLIAFGILSGFKFAEINQEALTWNIDDNHSSLSFEVRHFFSNVIGTFDEFEGDIKFNPEDLENSSILFTISIASVNTKNERRDNHLQSADFFNAEEWPSMKFESTSIHKDGDTFKAIGNITIRDVTKEIEVPINFLGQMAHPRQEGSFIGGFTSEFTIKRTDFGVGSGNFAATTTVGDEVNVTINLEVNRSTA